MLRRLLAIAILVAVGGGAALLYLGSQVEPIMCVSSGNMGLPAPTPPPPRPCPSGFGELP